MSRATSHGDENPKSAGERGTVRPSSAPLGGAWRPAPGRAHGGGGTDCLRFAPPALPRPPGAPAPRRPAPRLQQPRPARGSPPPRRPPQRLRSAASPPRNGALGVPGPETPPPVWLERPCAFPFLLRLSHAAALGFLPLPAQHRTSVTAGHLR